MKRDSLRYQLTAERKPLHRTLNALPPPLSTEVTCSPPTTTTLVRDPESQPEECPPRLELIGLAQGVGSLLGTQPGEHSTSIPEQSGETVAETVRRLIPVTPTVMDIAEAHSTELRWGGQTIVPWSVLHHIMAGLTVLSSSDPFTRLKWSLHEVDEIYTGDIGKLFKTPEQRALGEEIQRYIFGALVGFPLIEDATLLSLDVDLAVAEAYVLCPPGRGQFVSSKEGVFSSMELELTVYDLANMDLQDGVEVFATLVNNCLAEVQ